MPTNLRSLKGVYMARFAGAWEQNHLNRLYFATDSRSCALHFPKKDYLTGTLSIVISTFHFTKDILSVSPFRMIDMGITTHLCLSVVSMTDDSDDFSGNGAAPFSDVLY